MRSQKGAGGGLLSSIGIGKSLTGNCVGGRAEMAEECEHLRRHIGDQPHQASGGHDDYDLYIIGAEGMSQK